MAAGRGATSILGCVAGNLQSPAMSSMQNIEHQGLFEAMREALKFRDRQHRVTDGVDCMSQGVMA